MALILSGHLGLCYVKDDAHLWEHDGKHQNMETPASNGHLKVFGVW